MSGSALSSDKLRIDWKVEKKGHASRVERPSMGRLKG